MSHPTDYIIKSEQRRNDMAYAAQHRQLKEAQRNGLVISPLFNVNRQILPVIARALARGLAGLGSWCSALSCTLSTRYAPAAAKSGTVITPARGYNR